MVQKKTFYKISKYNCLSCRAFSFSYLFYNLWEQSFKMEIHPEDNHFKEEKSVLSPILKHLKVLKLIGGFPIAVHKKKLIFSKFELLKPSAHTILAYSLINVYTVCGIFWPETSSGNFLIYLEIFRVEFATLTDSLE